MGMSLDTLSKLNAEIDATFPVLKKADWRSVRKKRDTLASDSVRDRNGEDARDAGTTAPPVAAFPAGFV